MFSVNICINKVVFRIIIEYSTLQEVRRFRRKIYKNNDNNDGSGHSSEFRSIYLITTLRMRSFLSCISCSEKITDFFAFLTLNGNKTPLIKYGL